MRTLYKKLIILLCLYVTCAQVKAQVPGRQPQQANHGLQRTTPVKRDYASVVADFKRRYPDIPVQAKPDLKKGHQKDEKHPNTSYEGIRKQLMQRYPELQQQLTQPPVTTPAVKVEPRSYEWCVKNLLPRIQAMQKAAQEEAQQ